MTFKPGQSGNPSGRPKTGKIERLLKSVPQEELIRAILARLSKSELTEILVKSLTEAERRGAG